MLAIQQLHLANRGHECATMQTAQKPGLTQLTEHSIEASMRNHAIQTLWLCITPFFAMKTIIKAWKMFPRCQKNQQYCISCIYFEPEPTLVHHRMIYLIRLCIHSLNVHGPKHGGVKWQHSTLSVWPASSVHHINSSSTIMSLTGGQMNTKDH